MLKNNGEGGLPCQHGTSAQKKQSLLVEPLFKVKQTRLAQLVLLRIKTSSKYLFLQEECSAHRMRINPRLDRSLLWSRTQLSLRLCRRITTLRYVF